MIELSPDVEDRLRAKAARSGQAVNDYLRRILEQQSDFHAEAATLKPEDYPRAGED